MTESALDDWTYRGFLDDDKATRRIVIEKPEHGSPGPRQVLGELSTHDQDGPGFAWGYNGHGTSRAAAALLAHALDLGAARQAGLSFDSDPGDDVRANLREAFCVEVLAQFPNTWRLRRCVILRWAHSWYLHHAPDVMPPVLCKPIRAYPW